MAIRRGQSSKFQNRTLNPYVKRRYFRWPPAKTWSSITIINRSNDSRCMRLFFFIEWNHFSLFFQRVSQLPPTTSGGDFLPPLPSGFDDLPLVPGLSEPTADVRQILSPLQTRRGRIASAVSVEPSPTLQDKQKQKAINDLLK